jgi:hypothetical protein
MFDLMEDTTDEGCTHHSLELDRIKEKIRSIWNQLLVAQYKETYKYQSDEDEDYVGFDEYADKNKLQFAGEEEDVTEVDSILEMLEGILDNGDELSPVSSEGKAPSYGSTSLASNKDPSTVTTTTYNVKHSSTKPVSDSERRVKSGTYDKPTGGQTLKSVNHEQSLAHTKSLLEILDVERQRLLSLVAKNNKKYGVRL